MRTTALAILTLSIATAASAADFVVLKRMKKGVHDKQSGIVIQDSIKGVTLKVGRGRSVPTLSFKSSEVLRVEYEKTPFDYGIATEQLKNGAYKNALKNYKEMLQKGKYNPLLKQYVLYEMGQCYAGMGQNKKAIETFEKLLSEVPDTRFFTGVIAKVVETFMMSKDYAKARDWLPKLRKAGEEFKPVADLYEGSILEAERKWSRAKEIYNGVVGTQTGALRSEAMVGVARCEFAVKKYDNAKRTARKAIGKGEADSKVLASAHLVIANSVYETANRDKAKITEALFEYLRVVVLYNGHASSEPEALFKAGMCFESLQTGKDRTRAKEMYSRLIRRFPRSPFASQAKVRRGRLGG